jgi:PAS domain S-box-containing protein
MRNMPRKFSAVWLLFIGFAVSASFLVSGIGYYMISRDYQRFNTEALHLREEYIAGQQQQIRQEVEQVVEYIQYNWAKAEERLRTNLRDRTYEAFDIATNLYEVNQGKTNDREIRNLIVEALRPIRFNHGRGYYFATGLDGVEILFADRPELEGQGMLDTRDTQGAYVIRDMIELVRREGEGYYRYTWSKPNARGMDFPKIAFVKSFAPFNGFLGTGEYLDDVEQDIQQEVLDRIGKIRFGKDGYIFVVSYDGVTMMNGTQPELIGKNIWDMTDPNGVKVIQEERRAAEKAEGDFIQYHWEKPSTKEVRPKISFVKGFPQWRWMVGAGIYVDDIEPVIAGMDAATKKEMRQDLYGLAFTLAAILLTALLICFRLSHYFKRQIDVFLNFFKEAETGGRLIATEQVFLSEFHILGQSANRMLNERRKAEDDLRQSEEQFKAMFETASIGMAQTDPKSGQWLRVNQRMCETTGYSGEELLAMRIYEITHPEDRARDWEAFQNIISGKSKDYRLEKRYIRKDGTTVWVNVNMTIIRDADGQPLRTMATIEDITERKRAEEENAKLHGQLLQSQKMESIGRLAGGVAHDFNNMLGVILGHVEMAMDDVDPGRPLYATLQEIRKAAERSSDLTRQLLAFARKQTVSPRVLDLNDTVAGMLKMLQRLIGEDIHPAWLPGANLWSVKIDPSQIAQVLANLSVNARDAIEGVGKLTIETENAILDETYCAEHAGSVPGEYVMLAVSDDGCGMDKETLSRLFEPFFTTKGVGKGTGLGLATVYGIVKQNNGFIDVYSEPGHGTIFKIYLPRHKGKAGRLQKEVPGEPVATGHETILLVEDEPAVLNMTAIMLREQGYTVLATGMPGEALRLAEEHPGQIHMLITDVVMPEMNGRDLAKNILAFYPGLKRLFMSGYTANVIAHHGVLDEGVHFIQKPFSINTLARKVREVLED